MLSREKLRTTPRHTSQAWVRHGLRHLRYFVAVAEEGSVTVAAEKRLHTAQPSVSRQLRDLEQEVGAQLFTRGARGIELTPAGRAFLDHARRALAETGDAILAARRAARPARATFSVGFLTGQEVDWLPHVTRILRAELPGIEFKVISLYSPDLGDALQSGEIDLGFLRIEPRPHVHYQVIAKEPLVVILPSDHRLAKHERIDPHDLEGENFIGFSDVPHVLRAVVTDYLARTSVEITPAHHIDNFAIGISLVASTRGVALLPAYVEPLLPWSVISRPLLGEPPTIDLAVGYREDNPSPVLKAFLSGIDDLIAAGPGGSGPNRCRASGLGWCFTILNEWPKLGTRKHAPNDRIWVFAAAKLPGGSRPAQPSASDRKRLSLSAHCSPTRTPFHKRTPSYPPEGTLRKESDASP